MKRFAVLFGILAIAFACGTSYATAPQAGDVPDIRLDVGPTGTSSLPETATDAYDVFDYFKDVDDAPSALTVSIRNIQAILGSPPAPNIDIGGATEVTGVSEALVDVYGLSAAGWWEYTVRVDDASTASKGAVGADAISDSAVAKYSTFAVMEPTIEDGVFLKTGGETGMTRQFVYCYVGQALGQLYRLDVAVDPASASSSVDWEVYVSDVIYDSTSVNYDANGSWIGLDKPHGASGSATSYDGLSYAIDANGTMTHAFLVAAKRTIDAPVTGVAGVRYRFLQQPRLSTEPLPSTTWSSGGPGGAPESMPVRAFLIASLSCREARLRFNRQGQFVARQAREPIA
jgi:hypothetical protein